MKTLFIGIGNSLRKDDGVGITILRELQNKLVNLEEDQNNDEYSFSVHHGEGAQLMHLWEDFERVVIFDAVRKANTPGKIYELDARRATIPSDFFRYSSHAFSVAEAIELARAMDQLPDELLIYAVEGADFGFGEGLSSKIQASVDLLLEKLWQTFKLDEVAN